MNEGRVSSILIFLIIVALLPWSCNKEEKQPPTVSTLQVSEISYTSAMSGGEILDGGSGPVVAGGLCWSLSSEPTVEDNKSVETEVSGGFVSKITDLKPATEFFVRAYALNDAGIGYGEEIKFTTTAITTPSVETAEATSITATSVISGGIITELNGGEITEKGVCWNTSTNPVPDNNKKVAGYGPEAFSCLIEGLTPNTTYYLRAYAINSAGISYGNEIMFKTLGLPPVVTMSEVTDITFDHVLLSGKVENDGGSVVTLRGFCWSLFQHPDTSDSKSEDGTGTGVFTHEIIIPVEPETKYYVRAYAKNMYGISYGNEVSFLSGKSIQLFADSISGKTRTSANVHGHVKTPAGLSDVSYGICWGTSIFPTLDNEKKTITLADGLLTTEITNLKPWTVYFARIFAKTDNIVFYSNNISFSTLGKPPEIFTDDLTGVLTTDASHGNTKLDATGHYILSPGGSVDSYGFCWSKLHNPSVDDNQLNGVLSQGKFTATITNLEINTDYYVRAYVRDIYGIYYGYEKSFRINYTPPLAEGFFKYAYYYQKINAVYQVNYTNTASIPVLKFGVCWGTESNPTIDNNKRETTFGNMADFTLSGIDPGVMQYIRFYVVNDLGTYYSSNTTITRWYGQAGPQSTDADGNLYNSVKIGNQTWLVENLKTTKYLNGDVIGTTTPANLDISATVEPKYQWPAGGDELNVPEYGRLYTWHAATDSRKVCPAGWHVPSSSEWDELDQFMNSEGGDMKETGLTHWSTPNLDATNSSGYKGVGAGYRTLTAFTNMKNYAMFWSTNPTTYAAQYAYLHYNSGLIRINEDPSSTYSKSFGFSIRCLKD